MKPTYEELQQQLESTQREFRSADIKMQNLEAQLKQSKIDADCYKKGMEASNARLVQLAAENTSLKAFGDKLNEMHNDLNGEGTGIQGRAEVACQQAALEAAMEEFDALKTPATDAFLAEVRAQARTDFIGRIEWIIRNECNPEKTETILNELQSFSETVSQEAAQ